MVQYAPADNHGCVSLTASHAKMPRKMPRKKSNTTDSSNTLDMHKIINVSKRTTSLCTGTIIRVPLSFGKTKSFFGFFSTMTELVYRKTSSM